MKILSVSDVITNSSSEVFIIHSKPEVDNSEIYEEIKELLDSICELTGIDPSDCYTTDIAENSYIDEDWYYSVEEGDTVIESISDNTIPGWLMNFIEDILYMPRFKDKFSGYYATDLGEKEIPHDVWNSETREYETVTRKTEIESIQRHHLG